MQVALTFEESKQRTLVPKQVVGLAAALLAGAAMTPVNMQAVDEMNRFGVNTAYSNNGVMMGSLPESATNLKTMEEKAGSNAFTCLTVSNITLIEASKAIMELRSNIVESVRSWEGIKYKWGGRSKGGVDCSGLVQRVFRDFGIQLPRTSYEQFRTGVGIPRSKLEPGDLVFFNTNGAGASHVGIYVGNGQFISATRSCVEIQSLDHPYWASTYRGSRRVIS